MSKDNKYFTRRELLAFSKLGLILPFAGVSSLLTGEYLHAAQNKKYFIFLMDNWGPRVDNYVPKIQNVLGSYANQSRIITGLSTVLATDGREYWSGTEWHNAYWRGTLTGASIRNYLPNKDGLAQGRSLDHYIGEKLKARHGSYKNTQVIGARQQYDDGQKVEWMTTVSYSRNDTPIWPDLVKNLNDQVTKVNKDLAKACDNTTPQAEKDAKSALLMDVAETLSQTSSRFTGASRESLQALETQVVEERNRVIQTPVATCPVVPNNPTNISGLDSTNQQIARSMSFYIRAMKAGYTNCLVINKSDFRHDQSHENKSELHGAYDESLILYKEAIKLLEAEGMAQDSVVTMHSHQRKWYHEMENVPLIVYGGGRTGVTDGSAARLKAYYADIFNLFGVSSGDKFGHPDVYRGNKPNGGLIT